MKIFYCCPTGTYVSLVAANYHLGVISPEIEYRKIRNLPNFDSLTDDEIGQPIFIGNNNGLEIYTFGVKEENILLTNAMIDWLEVLNIRNEEYKIVDLTSLKANDLLKVGIFLSIKMNIKKLGGKLAARGLKIMLPSIAEIVDRVKVELT